MTFHNWFIHVDYCKEKRQNKNADKIKKWNSITSGLVSMGAMASTILRKKVTYIVVTIGKYI
jgi:hypothetical protein